MTGHINLWQNIYKFILCILHQLFNIILGVETSISTWLVCSRNRKRSKVTYLLYIPCAYFSELRQCFNFYAPTFIICKMQMQQVIFISYHVVNKLLHFIFCKEVAAYVKH